MCRVTDAAHPFYSSRYNYFLMSLCFQKLSVYAYVVDFFNLFFLIWAFFFFFLVRQVLCNICGWSNCSAPWLMWQVGLIPTFLLNMIDICEVLTIGPFLVKAHNLTAKLNEFLWKLSCKHFVYNLSNGFWDFPSPIYIIYISIVTYIFTSYVFIPTV